MQSLASTLRRLKASSTLVVGVSGGRDLMMLLDALHRLGVYKIIAAHFNHQLRGEESDGDERFVREQAVLRGIEFEVGRADVRGAAKGVSIEMAARKLRHEFLARIAAKNGADVVLAHHADDQVELFLMRVMRGMEGPGVAGMRPEAPSPANPNVRLLRPLLEVRQSRIAALARKNKVPFREDSSNTELFAERNRVRLVILPALRKRHGPRFDRTILAQVARAGELRDRLRAAANQWLASPHDFPSLPEWLQREIIATQLDRVRISITGACLKRLLSRPHARVPVSKDQFVSRSSDGMLSVHDQSQKGKSITVNLRDSGHIDLGDLGVSWRLIAKPDLAPDANRFTFDAARLGTQITLRHGRPGDQVRLSGRASHRPLKEMFSRNKIPRERRERLILATTAEGAIFWVEDLRIMEDFKVTADTKQFLEWRWERRRL